ncbi:MAG TPA: hypothetical protein VL099_13225 [Candidatus Binatia bacterium]|nr:hypothetical protein [Candidatus Binatia bacterium]
MITPLGHFGAMTVFAAAASVTLAFQSRPNNRERMVYAVKTFAMFVGGAIALAWLLYPISR